MIQTFECQGRTCRLFGEEAMSRLRNAHVLDVGIGGVCAYAADMLCRAGIGRLTLVDADTVQPSNINRQLPALHSTVGLAKAEVMAARFRDINPDIVLNVLPLYIEAENIPTLLNEASVNFILDAIATTSPKSTLIYNAWQMKIKIVSR